MKKLIVLNAVLALVVSASAGTLAPTADAPGVFAYGQTSRDPVYDYDVTGTESWDLEADPSNVVVVLDLAAALGLPSGTAIDMTGIGWDVVLATVGGSWLSEMKVYFDDNIAPDGSGLYLTPAAGDNFAGTGAYASGGIIDLSDNGIPDIPLADGMLRMEFFEGYDDVADAVDGLWESGFLNIGATPEPTSFALLGLAGLLIRRR